jgi:uncharacterized protein
MPATVKCPTCRRPVQWSEQSPYRPFCSERCRLVDLGGWFAEQRGIPDENSPADWDEADPADADAPQRGS